MIFIILQDTLYVAGRLAASENHTLWFLIFVKRILIQGDKTYALIFIVDTNNFIDCYIASVFPTTACPFIGQFMVT